MAVYIYLIITIFFMIKEGVDYFSEYILTYLSMRFYNLNFCFLIDKLVLFDFEVGCFITIISLTTSLVQ
jgi:hypothetical protein